MFVCVKYTTYMTGIQRSQKNWTSIICNNSNALTHRATGLSSLQPPYSFSISFANSTSDPIY